LQDMKYELLTHRFIWERKPLILDEERIKSARY